ncbi:unnamed protein product [Didymodactylos carnosus]|uniref:Uncharacterized protein n=2 Tax=Didymodactylos carnosus TaxID=1234261 RepID=A0A815AMA8_9BILA|nr:unnamed protein product [Didymodactylos carnosus]CAF4030094.1 unnamed protein product [Didymodactylos carnosus]
MENEIKKNKNIDNEEHYQTYEHPSSCPAGADCQDTSEDHENAYRHLPLCEQFQQCLKYRQHNKNHCEQFRHCHRFCELANSCVNFHDKKHIENYKHPFPLPCSLTPYHCALHEEFKMATDKHSLLDEIQRHCLNFAHVCEFGQDCTEKDPSHWEESIHIRRPLCPFGDQCAKLIQEDHLNSFTHPNIRDIRFRCPDADKCRDRRDLQHLAEFRHQITSENSGVVRYYNLNKDINFVQNHHDNIKRVQNYVKKQKWEALKSDSILKDIINWIRTVQPVHRCRAEIFESILLHGHVMSRNYMENLKKPQCVIDSVLQHNRLQQIRYFTETEFAKRIKEYVTALVEEEFERKRAENKNLVNSTIANSASRMELIQEKEKFLLRTFSRDDLEAIKNTAIEIAQASIKLHSNPAGLGYPPDKELGTDKNVFSILGPNLGHYYGDICIVFKREILHHPDANFSIQAATSYVSGRSFKWRPWLGDDPGAKDKRIELFHKTKLHASIKGYEYATALELIAVTGQTLKKKSMNINLTTILQRWVDVDSHMNIECHLPQLIPLDYIDHIYMSQNAFDSLNPNAQHAIDTIFQNRITKTPHEIELTQPALKHGPKPESKARTDYQDFVVKKLIDKFRHRGVNSLNGPIRGIFITIPPTEFTDHFVLPLTISQAYQQYKTNHSQVPIDIPVYIYWQVLHGDMMLTLSNEQIDTGESQPNLRCLTCYVAKQPTIKGTDYHENVSYLHIGGPGAPFEHGIVLKEHRYSAASNAFYVGCNTDNLMTFSLEIQRSTGTAILSHSGPNLIYNRKKISYTFEKSNLDLNQLNFIHASAGACKVPIRNLFVTFKKEPEPFDDAVDTAQPTVSSTANQRPESKDEKS